MTEQFDEIVADLEGNEQANGRHDPATGAPITPIEWLNRVIREQGGDAEIVEVKQVGQQDAQWYFTVRNKLTGEPVELKSLDTKKMETLPNLTARVREAGGGRMPRPRAGTEKHSDIVDAIDAAKVFHETGVSEETGWRRILARYIKTRGSYYKGRLAVRDLADPDEKRRAIEDPEPFVDQAHRLHVNAGHFLGYLEDRRRGDHTEPAVTAALKQLGFERQPQLTAKTDGTPATKRFWRAPAGFEWGSDE